MSSLAELAKLLGVKPGRGSVKEMVAKLKEVPYCPFPISFHTVDVIPYRYNDGLELLLGRKHNKTIFQFIGGFVDAGDTAEEAAVRELNEEANILLDANHPKMVYLRSHFIDDSRYKNSCHKISTSLYKVEVSELESIAAIGGDDIAEVKWFKYSELVSNPTLILGAHQELFNVFCKSL